MSSRQRPDPDPSDASSSLDTPGAHPTHDEIAVRAYEMFEASGRTEGKDGDHWLAAERELNAKYAAESPRARTKSA
jgi:hypothetical protein